MSDEPLRYLPHRAPGPERPLLGITVLAIEDSRFASEAIRLMCLRSGARMRRADSLAAAHRHLAVYRPTVVIADMGLPDGSGASLIAELAVARPRVPVLLGTSGDADAAAAALAAGADGFLPKPVENLAAFQQAILAHLPAGAAPRGPRALPSDVVMPDPVALEDDLQHAADILEGRVPGTPDYVAQFLAAVAMSAHDAGLAAAATEGARGPEASRRLAGLLETRIAALRAG